MPSKWPGAIIVLEIIVMLNDNMRVGRCACRCIDNSKKTINKISTDNLAQAVLPVSGNKVLSGRD